MDNSYTLFIRDVFMISSNHMSDRYKCRVRLDHKTMIGHGEIWDNTTNEYLWPLHENENHSNLDRLITSLNKDHRLYLCELTDYLLNA